MKVAELTDAELDYWVAKAEGIEIEFNNHEGWYEFGPSHKKFRYSPTALWHQAGPIITREGMSILCFKESRQWGAFFTKADIAQGHVYYGKSIQEACMRCFVASKFGETFDEEAIPRPSQVQEAGVEADAARLPATVDLPSDDKDAWV